jgi:hypothetical protein
VALHVDDYRGGWRLRVKGRWRPVPEPIAAHLDRWLIVRGSAPGLLLLAVNRGGRVLGGLTSAGAQKRLRLAA